MPESNPMIKRVLFGFTLLLILSQIWPANGAVNVMAAVSGPVLPAETIASNGLTVSPKILSSQQAVTTTTTYSIYLPLMLQGFCASSFSYNETIRYNLTKIKATTAWDSCYRGAGVTVAVVDTGVDLDHTDLAANLVSGKTFVDGTSSADDDYGHGTHVAGIIAAVNNNGGVIGVAPEASIMPVKVLNSSGSGSIADVADGIVWAADNGADIINLSLASTSSSTTLKNAVNYAVNKGVLLVAAGGNCGDSNYGDNYCSYQDQPVYPAAYSNVMAVASTDSSDSQSSFSNQGSYIDIAAPGSSIYSTYKGGSYATMSGTSMAAPHVAGLAALIWSQDSSLSRSEVWAQIEDTATDLGSSGWDKVYGYGRINAAAAMESAQTSAAGVSTVVTETAIETNTASTADYEPGQILLKLKTGVSVSDVVNQDEVGAADVQVAGTIDQLGVQKLTVATGQEQSLLAQLRSLDGVEYAELNYIVTVAALPHSH